MVVGCESTHEAPNDPANCAAAVALSSPLLSSRLISPLLRSERSIDRSSGTIGMESRTTARSRSPHWVVYRMEDRYLRCAARTVKRMRAHSGTIHLASRFISPHRHAPSSASRHSSCAFHLFHRVRRGVIPSFGREEEGFSPRFSRFLRRLDREGAGGWGFICASY